MQHTLAFFSYFKRKGGGGSMVAIRAFVHLDACISLINKFLISCRNFEKLGMNIMLDATSICAFQFSAINIKNVAEVRNSEREVTLALIDKKF
jgi:hypothetical protein